MKKGSILFLSLILFIMFNASAKAGLTVIGTAGYDSDGSGFVENHEHYKLIWDDDNNGNSVVWLDYVAKSTNWSFQMAWAAGLGTELAISLYDGYTVEWHGDWRLPFTADGPLEFGYDGTTAYGYNVINSEMGHLYYEELGNLGQYDTDGNTYPNWEGAFDPGDFDNLRYRYAYWSGTEHSDNTGLAWRFYMKSGLQLINAKINNDHGVAIHNATVSSVPIPGAIWLLGPGLLGMVGFRRTLC